MNRLGSRHPKRLSSHRRDWAGQALPAEVRLGGDVTGVVVSMTEAGRLGGKRALVTAAGQGIGRATALTLVADGAQVYATNINEDALADLAGDHGIKTFVLDVMDHDSVVAGVGKADPDILFNCAGFVRQRSCEEQRAMQCHLPRHRDEPVPLGQAGRDRRLRQGRGSVHCAPADGKIRKSRGDCRTGGLSGI